MIYTTYFDRLNDLPENVVPVSICGKAPDWFKGVQYKRLAPKKGFFSQWEKNHDNRFYTIHYQTEVLLGVDAQEIYKELIGLAGTTEIALVCYERPEEFCHRHLVANWLRENDFFVKEFGS